MSIMYAPKTQYMSNEEQIELTKAIFYYFQECIKCNDDQDLEFELATYRSNADDLYCELADGYSLSVTELEELEDLAQLAGMGNYSSIVHGFKEMKAQLDKLDQLHDALLSYLRSVPYGVKMQMDVMDEIDHVCALKTIVLRGEELDYDDWEWVDTHTRTPYEDKYTIEGHMIVAWNDTFPGDIVLYDCIDQRDGGHSLMSRREEGAYARDCPCGGCYYENCISCPYPTCTKGFVLAPFGDVLVSEPEQPTGEMPEPLFP